VKEWWDACLRGGHAGAQTGTKNETLHQSAEEELTLWVLMLFVVSEGVVSEGVVGCASQRGRHPIRACMACIVVLIIQNTFVTFVSTLVLITLDPRNIGEDDLIDIHLAVLDRPLYFYISEMLSLYQSNNQINQMFFKKYILGLKPL
jgi:hypothetical protein